MQSCAFLLAAFLSPFGATGIVVPDSESDPSADGDDTDADRGAPRAAERHWEGSPKPHTCLVVPIGVYSARWGSLRPNFHGERAPECLPRCCANIHRFPSMFLLPMSVAILENGAMFKLHGAQQAQAPQGVRDSNRCRAPEVALPGQMG